jgi:glutamate synthase (ferredoxin)
VKKNTGDGAGILMQVPDKFAAQGGRQRARLYPAQGRPLRRGDGLLLAGCGQACRGAKAFEKTAAEEGLKVLGWRDVPVNNSMIGATAKASEPFMRMAFIERGDDCPDQQTFERQLYIIRKRSVTKRSARRRSTTSGTAAEPFLPHARL